MHFLNLNVARMISGICDKDGRIIHIKRPLQGSNKISKKVLVQRMIVYYRQTSFINPENLVTIDFSVLCLIFFSLLLIHRISTILGNLCLNMVKMDNSSSNALIRVALVKLPSFLYFHSLCADFVFCGSLNSDS